MHGNLPFGTASARTVAAQVSRESFPSPVLATIVADEEWFMRIAHSLWPDKPTAWLCSLTNFPERTCRSYANGEREPSGPFLIALLLSEQGERVLCALLSSKCEWLDRLLVAKRKADAFLAA